MDTHIQNLDKDRACLLLMLCWKLWLARNDKVWNGFLKLNTDATVIPNSRRMGFGWVLRNDCGKFIDASIITGKGVFSPKEAEVMAIREALTWIKRKGINVVNIETDALQITPCFEQEWSSIPPSFIVNEFYFDLN
nr:uncharacterized protein LOC109191080 [Ipomoea batatas]